MGQPADRPRHPAQQLPNYSLGHHQQHSNPNQYRSNNNALLLPPSPRNRHVQQREPDLHPRRPSPVWKIQHLARRHLEPLRRLLRLRATNHRCPFPRPNRPQNRLCNPRIPANDPHRRSRQLLPRLRPHPRSNFALGLQPPDGLEGKQDSSIHHRIVPW